MRNEELALAGGHDKVRVLPPAFGKMRGQRFGPAAGGRAAGRGLYVLRGADGSTQKLVIE